MTRHRGFTLLELMIVIAIIGILASVALPSYQNYLVRAQVVEALTLSNELKPAIRDYYRDRGVFPADNEAAGAPAPEHLLGNYVSGIVIEDGAMHVTFGNRAHASIAGEVLSIRPIYVTANPPSPIGFSCGRSGAPEGMSAAGADRTTTALQFLPSACRP